MAKKTKNSAVMTFIEDERAKGTSEQSIKDQLIEAGWGMDIIQKAMGEIPTSTLSSDKVTANLFSEHRRTRTYLIGAVAVVVLLLLLAAFI